MLDNPYNYDIQRSGPVNNDEALIGRVINMFSISRNTLPFQRDNFIDLEMYLLSTVSFSTANILRTDVEDAITRFFPDLTIRQLTVEVLSEERTYRVNIIIRSPFSGRDLPITRDLRIYD